MLTYKKACEIAKRMCDKYSHHCAECRLSEAKNGSNRSCPVFFMENYEKVEPILADWDEKNPVRTILDEFKENYPDADINDDGYLDDLCPSKLGYETNCFEYPSGSEGCVECWSRPAKKK